MKPTSNPYVWVNESGALYELKFNHRGEPRMVAYQGEAPDLLQSEVNQLRSDLEELKTAFETHVHGVPGGRPGASARRHHKRLPSHDDKINEITEVYDEDDPRLETITRHKP